MLPLDIEKIIFEFHDQYNLIEKKLKINYIIKRSYLNWLSDTGMFCSFIGANEYQAKREIYPLITPTIFITNSTLWKFFLEYFKHCENYLQFKETGMLP